MRPGVMCRERWPWECVSFSEFHLTTHRPLRESDIESRINATLFDRWLLFVAICNSVAYFTRWRSQYRV